MSDLPYLDVDKIIKDLSGHLDTGAKRDAQRNLRNYVEKATLLQEQHATLRAIAMDQARQIVALEIANEALKNSAPGAVTKQDLYNLERAIFDRFDQIFSEQSEKPYQPVVKTPTPQHVDLSRRGLSPEYIHENYIEVERLDDESLEWEAHCYFENCNWDTDGSESVVEDAAYEHAETHARTD